MVPLKSFNWQVFAAGAPGTGKSYWMRRHVWQTAREVDGYVLAHDPTGSFDAEREIPWRRHRDAKAAAAGIAKLGGGVVHVVDVEDGGELLELGKLLGEASMRRAAQARTSLYSPVIVYVDEAVGAEGIQPTRLTPQWRDAIARRRHYGIGLALTGQSVYFAHRSILTLSTRVEIFRLADPADGDRLAAIGLPADVAAELHQLPDRAHISIVGGRLVDADPPALRRRYARHMEAPTLLGAAPANENESRAQPAPRARARRR